MRTSTVRTAVALGALLAAVGVSTPAAASPAVEQTSCSWALVDTPPSPSGSVPLSDVDVVGRHDVRIDGRAEAPAEASWELRWNGRELVDDQPMPITPLVTTLTPYDIAYSSGSDGWAVTGTGSGEAMERWSGGRWTLMPLAVTPDAATEDYWIEDVAAVSPTNAWSVGAAYEAGTTILPRSHALGTLIEHWDGTAWQVTPNPAADQDGAKLLAIAASSANDVWAVGYQQDADGAITPFTEHYDGTSWTVVPAPSGHGTSELRSVSIGPDGTVWAAGNQELPSGNNAAAVLAERWDGSAWQVDPLPDLGNARIDALYVAAANSVWALVEEQSGANRYLHWDGTAWSVGTMPGPQEYGLTYAYAAIDGSGPDDVWAVGNVTDYSTLDTEPQVAHLHCGRGGR
ncbi:hypothetical protein [Actinocatenispora sera]|uniref:Uncharacterized protein n=1 Tax=Actinocatenispora sera TaxID=390989 RepID=A0A810KUH7_9ACTN|nr:hypothetical protein [Actinocatenispora sera]BCJ25916.1 hypothetical protein Asera_00240 [Actinocatenispora sera]